MKTVSFNLFTLIKQLETQRRENITIQEIAEKAGLNRLTVQGIIENRTNRVDLTTLAKLLQFFEGEGMTVAIGELFEVTSST